MRKFALVKQNPKNMRNYTNSNFGFDLTQY